MKLSIFLILILVISCGQKNSAPKVLPLGEKQEVKNLEQVYQNIEKTNETITLFKESLQKDVSLRVSTFKNFPSFKYYEETFHGTGGMGEMGPIGYSCPAQLRKYTGKQLKKANWENGLIYFLIDGERMELQELIDRDNITILEINNSEVYLNINFSKEQPEKVEMILKDTSTSSSYHVGFHKWVHIETCPIDKFYRNIKPQRRKIDVEEDFLFDIELRYYRN